MNLVDRNGRAIPVVKERKALGFIERTVKADDGDVVSGVTPGPMKDPEPGWQSYSPIIKPTWATKGDEA